ncbi:2141_t:CDS:2 [Acaulospora colombiana]|uniref:2141_t:CDS:1 n=1 Tax=Acaulospora colombiana TaxID=27376 RepID=A0ACA9NPL2_9GLOM|nr:2141_t:CDS:2 [Acaulospora colombiana]
MWLAVSIYIARLLLHPASTPSNLSHSLVRHSLLYPILLSSRDTTTLTVLVAVGLGALLLGSLLTIIVEAYRRRWRRNHHHHDPEPQQQQSPSYCANCKSKEAGGGGSSPGMEDTFMHAPQFSPCSLSATFNRQSIKPPMNMFNNEPKYVQWSGQPSSTSSSSNQISVKVSAPTEETTYQEVVIQKFQKRSKTKLENWHLGPRASTRSSSISSNEGSTSNTVVGGGSIHNVPSTTTMEKPAFTRSKSEPRQVALEYDPFRKSSISSSIVPSSPPPTDRTEFHPIATTAPSTPATAVPRRPQPVATRYDVSGDPHIYRRKSESRINQTTRREETPSFGSEVPAGRLRALSTPQRPVIHDHQSYNRNAVPEFPQYPPKTRTITPPSSSTLAPPVAPAVPARRTMTDGDSRPDNLSSFAFPRKQPVSPADSNQSSGEGDRSSQLLPDAMAHSFYKEHANKHLSLPPTGVPNIHSAVLPDSPSGVRGDGDGDSEVDFSFARGRAI